MEKLSIEERLFKITQHINQCINCSLHETRTNVVPGAGSISNKIMFIGEAPGKEEDLQGRPFVGRSGKLLNELIEAALQMKRDEVYISNILKCRPTEKNENFRDRPPMKTEIKQCIGFIKEEIEIIKPHAIITLGATATKAFVDSKDNLTKIRGKSFMFNGCKVCPTFHPSYILRNGGVNSRTFLLTMQDIKKSLSK